MIVDLLRDTNPTLLNRLGRKMMNYLFKRNIPTVGELLERWKTGAAVNAPDMATFYTPGPKGYTDYPVMKK